MDILSFFSRDGSPATWLYPTINIKDVDWNIFIDWDVMTEVGDGFYKIDFNADKDVSYVIIATWWDDTLDSNITYWWWNVMQQASIEDVKEVQNYTISSTRWVEAILGKLSKTNGEMFSDLTNNIKNELWKQKPKELVERVVEKEKVVVENKIDTEQLVSSILSKLEEKENNKKEQEKKQKEQLMWLFTESDAFKDLFKQENLWLFELF